MHLPWTKPQPPGPCHQPGPSEVSPAGSRFACRLLILGLIMAVGLGVFPTDDSDAKRKKKRRVEPPLRIASVTMSPQPYVSGNGSLDVAVEVIIPPGTDGSTILEVSALISSPSMREVRFLSIRRPIEAPPEESPWDGSGEFDDPAEEESVLGTSDEGAPGPVLVTLSWDGTDQYRQLVKGGRYEYVIRAKLLASTIEGLRTRMVTWKEKGTLRVKAPPATLSEDADGEGSDVQDPLQDE